MRRHSLTIAFAVSVMFAPTVAQAGDEALAETLFREGRQLMDKGDYTAACPKLAESYEQDAATGTLLALAACYELSGNTATAWATYMEVVTRSKREGQLKREQAARERIEALEPRLSRLVIRVNPAAAATPGLVVKRDRIALGSGAWGVAAPVDPGEHVIEATAPGKVSFTQTVRVGKSADTQELTIPPLEDAPVTAGHAARRGAPSHASVSTTNVEPTRDTADVAKGPPLRMIGLVTAGVGAATLGVSGYFALRALRLNEESKGLDLCDENDNCTETGLERRNEAIDASNWATGTLIAGGVLAAAGATLFVIGEQESGVAVMPAVAPGHASLTMRGRF